jgi:hypothetical protein
MDFTAIKEKIGGTEGPREGVVTGGDRATNIMKNISVSVVSQIVVFLIFLGPVASVADVGR